MEVPTVRVDALFRLIVAIFIASIPLILAITRTARQRMRRAEDPDRRKDVDRQKKTDRRDVVDRWEESNRRYEKSNRREADRQDSTDRRTRPGRQEGREGREPPLGSDRPRPLARLRAAVRAAIENIASGFDSAWQLDNDEDLRERVVVRDRAATRPGAGAGAGETAPASRRRRETPIPEPTYRRAAHLEHENAHGAVVSGGRREEASPSQSREVPGTPISGALRGLARVERRPVLQRAILYGEILGSPAGLRSPEEW